MNNFRIALYFLLIFLFSCESEKNIINIGTFNIQWLGDGINDNVKRNQEDYLNITEVIKLSGADILGLQEIENEKSIELVLNQLDDYNYKITNYAEFQNQAIIYNKSIEISNFKTYFPLKINEDTRPGIVAEINYAGTIINFMSVHLKSTSRYDSTDILRKLSYEYREKQAEVIQGWIDSLSKLNRKFIITGDFNDNPTRKSTSISILEKNSNAIFLTDGFTSCKNKLWKAIDHIVISKNLYDYYMEGSNRIVNIYNMKPDSVAKKISDHCPVMATFKF